MGKFIFIQKRLILMTTQEKSIEEKLNEHPDLKEFVLSTLELVNSTEITADKAEEILVDRIREYGPKLLEEWAKKKNSQR
jgi:hypothetical protein